MGKTAEQNIADLGGLRLLVDRAAIQFDGGGLMKALIALAIGF